MKAAPRRGNHTRIQPVSSIGQAREHDEHDRGPELPMEAPPNTKLARQLIN
jgi:hypothetical protein